MGTFHHGKGDLHGITVVVDLNDSRVFVGRCDTVLPEGVVLLDADMHDEAVAPEGGEPVPKATYLENARKFGVWKKYDRIVVPSEDVKSVVRLGDL